MGRKRTRIDIIGDMLVSIQKKGGRIKPTHFMYNSNLSHVQMSSYLEELVEKNFVKKVRQEESYEYIMITDKGYEFLQRLQE